MTKSILSVVALFSFLGTAHASGGADVQGAACTPKGGALSSYAVTNTGVTFFGTVTGAVDFYCALPNAPAMGAPATFTIQYTDDTGIAGNEVVATYYKMDKSTGTLSAVANIFTHTGCTTGTFKTCSTNFVDTFDPSTYRYFVAVTIERGTATPTEIFYGASIY